jgi:hypothetical protein
MVMTNSKLMLLALALFAGSYTANTTFAKPEAKPAPATNNSVSLNFDNLKSGKLPAGWKVNATGSKTPLATWKVIKDKSAPSGNKVLALTSINHRSGRTFNICMTDSIHFLDGEISVKFKADSGNIDRGGGIIWHAQDADNYYVARFNPLEDNFRIYYVKNSRRHMIYDSHITLPSNQWIEMRIVQHKNQFKAYLNNKKLIEGQSNIFPQSGGVGLWTKADAATSFDDFSVKPETTK